MKFKESPLVKNHKILTGTKRDMRKKVVKSTTPTSDLKKPTTLKRQLGGNIFTTYNSIAPYEGPVFEQPVATVEIKELPVNRLETNRQNVMAKAEEKKEEPVVEEKVNTEPLPTSREETPVVENKESTPINIKSKDEFIKTMTPAFENALKAKGLDTKYAKYLVAQSALESNWGKSQSGKFNFGGIKGKGTIRKTREVINGKSIHINDSFRDFKDIDDYANYHVSLLNNKRYNAFTGDFIDRVVKGGYATDPNYKRALSNVYNQIAKAKQGGIIKAQDGILTKAYNKIKEVLPKEEPKESIDVVEIAKQYAPSAATSFLSGSINPFINKLLEGKKSSLDYSHKFGSTGNKFEEFANVMTPIFKEALEENGLPTTNLNNLVRQAALESNYGLDPRGERGFNLSGIKHPGDSIAPKYKKSRYKDGFDYIDFGNLKDYANYKVKVLNDRYKALDAKDTNDFIDRLHGNNSGGHNYSADKDSYRRNLNGTLSLNKYLKRGGIIKYQNPSSGIQRKDAIKDYRPQIQESIKQQYTPTYSEISQDNRSEWEKSQSREKADKAYKDYIQAKNTEEGLHNLNGFLTFTDYVGLGTGVGSIIGRGLKSGLKHILKKEVRNKMEKEILSDGYVNVGQYLDSNRGNSIETMGRNFVEYLNQPETIKRLKSIDDELGTDYLKGREWFSDQYNKGYVRFTPADKWTASNSSTAVKSEMFFRKPDYRQLKTTIIRQDPDHAVGHELKHGIEDYLEVLQNPNITIEEYIAQHGKGKRLQKLFDKDNIRTWDEFVEAVRKDKPDASEENLREAYKYLTQESEFSSNLHPLVEGNLKNGKPGVPNFKNVEELENAINGYYYPYTKKDDPMMNVKTIYNYLVKDKERFRQILNKYGWGVATPMINANPRYNKND